MTLATLCFNDVTNIWSAKYGDKTLVSSASKKYVTSRILEGKCPRALKLKVTGFSNLPLADSFAPSPIGGAAKAFVPRVKPNNKLSVEERYELLDECVEIVIQDVGIRSLIITGKGSLGKTFHTKEKIKAHNLISTAEARLKALEVSDEDKEIIVKIEQQMNLSRRQAEEYYKANPVKAAKDEDTDEDNELELNFGPVKYDLHLSTEMKDRRCAGQFLPGINGYRFNLTLAKENIDEFIEVVVPHEIAHQIQHQLFPNAKNPHGKEWRGIMTDCFEIPGNRYHSMDTESVRLAPELEGDYHYIKGYSSAKGLYRTLYENRSKLVVFDDCDAAWKNEVGANILKAALDTDEQRWVSWNVEMGKDDDLPTTFLFSGRVIFISNVASEDFPQPLISRSLRADIELTIEERFTRMEQILPSEKFAPGVSIEVKKMAFDFLVQHKDDAAEISSRSLLNVIQVANSGSKLWKRIALANIA
jgi:predicted SprT family Zn-dependent metalloprotease